MPAIESRPTTVSPWLYPSREYPRPSAFHESVDPAAITWTESDVVRLRPLLSVTFTCTRTAPAAVGVPERTPADDSERPAGSAPVCDQVSAPVPPDPVSVAL